MENILKLLYYFFEYHFLLTLTLPINNLKNINGQEPNNPFLRSLKCIQA